MPERSLGFRLYLISFQRLFGTERVSLNVLGPTYGSNYNRVLKGLGDRALQELFLCPDWELAVASLAWGHTQYFESFPPKPPCFFSLLCLAFSSSPGFWAGCEFIWGRCHDASSLPMTCEGGTHGVMRCLPVTRFINNPRYGSCLSLEPSAMPSAGPKAHSLALPSHRASPVQLWPFDRGFFPPGGGSDMCLAAIIISISRGAGPGLHISSEPCLPYAPLFLTPELKPWVQCIGWNTCPMER